MLMRNDICNSTILHMGYQMSEIPYTPLAGMIEDYFGKFQETGVPSKVNADWLKSLGYKSGNDSYIIAVLKFIGFVDNSNIPTDLWRSYKDPTRSTIILAKAIRIARATFPHVVHTL